MVPTFEEEIQTMPLDSEASRPYLEKHLPRLAKTLELVPQSSGGRALLYADHAFPAARSRL
jgi:hypothetical protein